MDNIKINLTISSHQEQSGLDEIQSPHDSLVWQSLNAAKKTHTHVEQTIFTYLNTD